MINSEPCRLAVLISGNGTNLQALIDSCSSGILPAKVVVVVSNRNDAYGLERARQAGIATLIKERKTGQDWREYDGELSRELLAYSPEWIVLAGWMRILSIKFLGEFPNRVINIHPALPGTFTGTHAIERAFIAYQKGEIEQTGVMIHYVPDEGVDCGPILNQEIVPIHPTDTIETLENRVHSVEHKLIVETLANLIQISSNNQVLL